MILKKKHNKKLQFDRYQVESFGDFLLYQIGDLICDREFKMEKHLQPCHEISLILDGKGIFKAGNKEYSVKKNDIFFNKLGEEHEIISDPKDPLRYVYAGFVINSKNEMYVEMQNVFENLNVPITSDKYSLNTCFNIIFNEIINNTAYSKVIIKNAIEQILIYTYRNFLDMQKSDYVLVNTLSHKEDVLYEIIHYIDKNYMEMSDLKQIGSDLGYNYSYLSRVFSETFGYSIKDYYSKLRFEAAAKFLLNADYNITEIAEKLNFQSVHSFSRAFKDYFGMCPSAYIKNNKDNIFSE